MGASIWSPGQAVSAQGLVQDQAFVATAGQTVFTITDFSYEPGTGSLQVFVSGICQRPRVDFTETSTTSFTLDTAVAEDTIVLAVAHTAITAEIPVVDVTPAAVGADKFVRIDGAGTGFVGRTAAQVLADIAAEPADGTILKDADIGVTVQAYDADTPTVIVSQVDAEAGVATDPRTWTAERVAQAIAVLAVSVSPGTIIDFGGAAAPVGYLVCNGAAVSRATYAALFTAIGTLWGVGDGSTTFNVPNFAAGDASVQTSGTVGAVTDGQMPAHTHAIAAYTQATSYGYIAGGGPPGQAAGVTNSTGSGTRNFAAGNYVLKCIKT